VAGILSGLKPDGALFGPVGFSVLGVILVLFITPLVMGGTIALAISMSGEQGGRQTPEDANGFQWVKAGACDPMTSKVGTTSTATAVTTNWSGTGVNYTTLPYPGPGTSSSAACKNATVRGPFEIAVPGSLFNDSEIFSRVRMDMVSSLWCSTSGSYCSQGFQFKYSMRVNGTVVASGRETSPSLICSYDGRPWPGWGWAENDDCGSSSGGDHWYSYLRMDVELNGLEATNFKTALDACAPSCNVTIMLEDVEKQGTGTSFNNGPWSNAFKIKVQVYTTDIELHGLLWTSSAWVLGIFFALLALGSTTFWNPFAGWVKGAF